MKKLQYLGGCHLWVSTDEDCWSLLEVCALLSANLVLFYILEWLKKRPCSLSWVFMCILRSWFKSCYISTLNPACSDTAINKRKCFLEIFILYISYLLSSCCYSCTAVSLEIKFFFVFDNNQQGCNQQFQFIKKYSKDYFDCFFCNIITISVL